MLIAMNPSASNPNYSSTTLSIDTIVVPQGAEYKAVDRGLQQTGAKDISVIAIAIGSKNVLPILAEYSRLDDSQGVLIMGLGGSLDPSYVLGDALLIQSCEDLAHNRISLDRELTGRIKDKLSVDIVAGLTSDRPICRSIEKLKLAQQYSASVVEMEGYGYISQLQQQGIAVAMLRVISDDLRGDLPDLSQAIDNDGNLQPLSLAIAFWQQPIAAMRLIKGSLTGLKVLQKITAELFTAD